jgi:hypothetical protein
MKRLLILTLCAALAGGACGTVASDATDGSSSVETGAAAGAAATPAVAKAAAPARPIYRDVTIPSGTTLPLALTSSMASDTSAVEDPVTAELTRAVSIDGRDVLPAGAQLEGVVTEVDDSGRVKGKGGAGHEGNASRSWGGCQQPVDCAVDCAYSRQLTHEASRRTPPVPAARRSLRSQPDGDRGSRYRAAVDPLRAAFFWRMSTRRRPATGTVLLVPRTISRAVIFCP